MTSRIAPRSLIFKIAENHHGAHFYMWGQNSNNCNLYIVGKEILSGLMLSEELESKNEHISSYISSHMHIFRKSCRCFGSQKTFIFVYLMSCPAESIGKLRYNILLHLQNSVHWAPVQFFLCPQVTVHISGSITIYLLGIITNLLNSNQIPQDSNWSPVSISNLKKLRRHYVI